MRSSGKLRVIAAASAPSASNQPPRVPSAKADKPPTSSSNVDKRTPVHSQHDSKPCVSCTGRPLGPFHSLPVLPEHSRK